MNRKELVPSIFNISIPSSAGCYIYNTYTGAILKFDKSFDRFIEACTDEELDILQNQGLLVNRDVDEVGKLIMERRSTIHNSKPSSLYFEISPTMKCQAKCVYCFENKMQFKPDMSDTIAEKTVDFIIERLKCTGASELTIDFFGGEPCLQPNTIFFIGNALKTYCQKNDIVFHSEMTTNGILFNSELSERMKDEISLKKVQITLDGLRDKYFAAKGIDAFDVVIQNILDVCQSVDVVIRLNVYQDNKEDIERLIEYLANECDLCDKVTVYVAQIEMIKGCTIGDDSLCDLKSFSTEKLDIYRKYLNEYGFLKPKHLIPYTRRRFCGMECAETYSIRSDGKLFKCSRALSDDKNAVGDVVNGPLYNRVQYSFSGDLNQSCIDSKCPILPVCYGGCPQVRVFDHNMPNCKVKKEDLINGLGVLMEVGVL